MSATAVPPTPLPTSATPPPRSGQVQDNGSVRRDSVRAQNWTLRGAAKILGDVDVDSADLSGLVTIRGSLTGGSVTAHGTFDVGGPSRLERALSASGTVTLGKDIDAPDVEFAGAARIAGALRAPTRLRWKGTLEVDGDVTAGRVEFDGRAIVGGAVVASEIVGRLRDHSRVASIRADRVTIGRASRLMGGGDLEVLTIEAKEVDLEAVTAQHVRAERIALGPGCQIAEVEGTIVRQHPSAHVGPASHSAPPHGLFR